MFAHYTHTKILFLYVAFNRRKEEFLMRDPHVQSIHYEIGSGEGISYSDPEPISFSNHLGEFDLSDNKLRIAPAEHFSDEDNARSAVESFLKAWEIEADLNSNVGTIRFKFERVELIDRDPSPPGSSHVMHLVGESLQLTDSVSSHLTCTKYPQPPKTFRATPEVEQAYRRWIGFRSGKEPLQGMAYWVLTLIESIAGNGKRNRKEAARSFQIDKSVLDTIGRLSSEKGDESTARKVQPGNQFQELSGAEKEWLEQAVRRVIYRLGERASGAPLTQISLTDLPAI
jgi:hypothetical protein